MFPSLSTFPLLPLVDAFRVSAFCCREESSGINSGAEDPPVNGSSPSTGLLVDQAEGGTEGEPFAQRKASLAACADAKELPGFPPNMRVVVAGVEPPPATPLAWLHSNLKHLDHFLYIVVHLYK